MKGKAGKNKRRRSALVLLEAQLKRGNKPEKVAGHTTTNNIQLSEGDVKKIKTQIDVLTKKVG